MKKQTDIPIRTTSMGYSDEPKGKFDFEIFMSGLTFGLIIGGLIVGIILR